MDKKYDTRYLGENITLHYSWFSITRRERVEQISKIEWSHSCSSMNIYSHHSRKKKTFHTLKRGFGSGSTLFLEAWSGSALKWKADPKGAFQDKNGVLEGPGGSKWRPGEFPGQWSQIRIPLMWNRIRIQIRIEKKRWIQIRIRIHI